MIYVLHMQVDRAENINRDIPLATACKADAEKLCADKYEVGPPQACSHVCKSSSPCHACCLHAGSAIYLMHVCSMHASPLKATCSCCMLTSCIASPFSFRRFSAGFLALLAGC